MVLKLGSIKSQGFGEAVAGFGQDQSKFTQIHKKAFVAKRYLL